MPAEPEQRRHRVRYVVEQNVEVEAGRAVHARSRATTAARGCIAVFRRFSPS